MTSFNEATTCYAVPADAVVWCTHIGVRAPREPFAQPRRVMNEFVIFFVTDGEIHLTDEMPGGTERVTVRAGEVHVVAPGIWQSSTVPFTPGIRFLWLHFAVEAQPVPLNREEAGALARRQFSPGGAASEGLIPRHFSFGDDAQWFAKLHAKAHDAARLLGLSHRGTQVLCGAWLFELQRRHALSSLAPGAAPAASIAAVHAQRAGVYIRLNAHRPLSARHVAAALGLNSAYLQRCFTRETGQTLGDFILQQKLELSRHLLRDGSLSIKQVAQQCGFTSSTYFGRMFARAEGCSASEFRHRLMSDLKE